MVAPDRNRSRDLADLFDVLLYKGGRGSPHCKYVEEVKGKYWREGLYCVSLGKSDIALLQIEYPSHARAPEAPSGLVSVSRGDVEDSSITLHDYERFLVDPTTYAHVRVVQSFLGRDLNPNADLVGPRKALEALWPHLIRFQAAADQWHLLDWQQEAVRMLERAEIDVFWCTDSLGPAAWINPKSQVYLLQQWRAWNRSLKRAPENGVWSAPSLEDLCGLLRTESPFWNQITAHCLPDAPVSFLRILRWTKDELDQGKRLGVLEMLRLYHEISGMCLLVSERPPNRGHEAADDCMLLAKHDEGSRVAVKRAWTFDTTSDRKPHSIGGPEAEALYDSLRNMLIGELVLPEDA